MQRTNLTDVPALVEGQLTLPHDPGWDVTYTLGNGHEVSFHITSREAMLLMFAVRDGADA